jgi:competence protein ComEC
VTPDPPRTPAARRRAFAALAAFAGGIVAGARTDLMDSAGWLGASLLLAALALAGRGWTCRLALVGALACLGAGWFTSCIDEAPGNSLGWVLRDAGPGRTLTLEGVALDRPERRESVGPFERFRFDAPAMGFPFEARRLREGSETRPVRGRVWVRVAGLDAGAIEAGAELRVTGIGRGVEAPLNPGEHDRRRWSAQDGFVGNVRVASPGLVEHLEPRGLAAAARRGWLGWRASLRARTGELLLGSVPADTRPAQRGRALLAAIVLGEREPALHDVRSAFTRVGLAHVLAISGFHLALMAGLAAFAVRLTGDRPIAEPVVVALVVLVYLAVVPAHAPILRAAGLVLAFIAAEAFGRRYDRLTLLAWIGLALLVLRPMDVFSMGYQLTMSLTGVLMWIEPRVGALGRPGVRSLPRQRREAGRLMLPAARALTASVATWAVAAPIVLHHTGLLSPLAPLTTLVAAPLACATLAASHVTILAGALVPGVSPEAGTVLGGLAAWTVRLVDVIDAAPGTSLYLPLPSSAWTASGIGLALVWIARWTVRDRGLWAAALILAGWLAVQSTRTPADRAAVVARVDALAVGDGSCLLVRSGGESLLWDCGSIRLDVGQVLVPRALAALGSPRVRTIVITHPDLDHYSGVPDVLRPLGVQRVLVGEAFVRAADRSPRGGAAILLRGLDDAGIEVRVIGEGDQLRLGRSRLRFISPPAGAAWEKDNDHSLAAMVEPIEGAGPAMLLTGDIEAEAMRSLLARHDPAADVLELPHHGSAHEPAYQFVARVGPRVVIQSTGPSRGGDTRWDHARRGREWLTTAVDGASWVEISAGGVIRGGTMR